MKRELFSGGTRGIAEKAASCQQDTEIELSSRTIGQHLTQLVAETKEAIKMPSLGVLTSDGQTP